MTPGTLRKIASVPQKQPAAKVAFSTMGESAAPTTEPQPAFIAGSERGSTARIFWHHQAKRPTVMPAIRIIIALIIELIIGLTRLAATRSGALRCASRLTKGLGVTSTTSWLGLHLH